jgi:hypothetical protein
LWLLPLSPSEEETTDMKILVTYDPPPIPDRRMDLTVYDVDDYEAEFVDGAWHSHGIVGYGRTWEDAIEDFREQHLAELNDGEDLPEELETALHAAYCEQERYEEEDLTEKTMDPQTGVLNE